LRTATNHQIALVSHLELGVLLHVLPSSSESARGGEGAVLVHAKSILQIFRILIRHAAAENRACKVSTQLSGWTIDSVGNKPS
jgi:hypothetical protein